MFLFRNDYKTSKKTSCKIVLFRTYKYQDKILEYNHLKQARTDIISNVSKKKNFVIFETIGRIFCQR